MGRVWPRRPPRPAVEGGGFSVAPLDKRGNDGRIDHVRVETPFYSVLFDLELTGSAESMIYKPLKHQFRAENYYSSPLLATSTRCDRGSTSGTARPSRIHSRRDG